MDSSWDSRKGLHTLIPTLLNLNVNGYTMVLPDIIGGNNYEDYPASAELFIRWLQACTFMPALQFSYVPWDFKNTEVSFRIILRGDFGIHSQLFFSV